jgi:cytochrome c5
MSSDHDTPIKTPKQLITVVALSFIVPIIVIALLVSYVNSQKRLGAGTSASDAQAVAQRIKPIAGFELRDASTPRVLKTGEEVYKAQCTACHAVGAAGAPKTGDVGAWAARIKTGYDALVNSALKGKGAMSAQGGGDYSDEEIARAVVYMTNQSGGKFAEPVAKAAAAEPAPSAVSAASSAAVSTAPAVAAAAAPVVAAVTTAAAPAGADKGKALYEKACVACHAAGVAGAPKFGDKAAWSGKVGAGVDALTASVIKGKGAMPAKGGSGASDAEIKEAVEYMLKAVK